MQCLLGSVVVKAMLNGLECPSQAWCSMVWCVKPIPWSGGELNECTDISYSLGFWWQYPGTAPVCKRVHTSACTQAAPLDSRLSLGRPGLLTSCSMSLNYTSTRGLPPFHKTKTLSRQIFFIWRRSASGWTTCE